MRIVTRASRDTVVGMRGDAILVRVTAAPVEGAANAALLRVLARSLRVPGGAVRLVGGRAAKLKLIEVDGLDKAEVMRRLDMPSGLVP